jgi:hypothetical protein
MKKWTLVFTFLVSALSFHSFSNDILSEKKLTYYEEARDSLNDWELESSIFDLYRHIEKTRVLFKGEDSSLKEKLFYTTHDFLKSYTNTLFRKYGICLFKKVEKRSECIRENLEEIAEEAYDEFGLDKIVYLNLIKASEVLYLDEENRLYFNISELKEDPDHEFNKVPDLARYLKDLNYFKKVRKDITLIGDYDGEVFSLVTELYPRESDDLGDLTQVEYLFTYFTKMQINIMGKMIEDMMDTVTSYRGEFVAYKDDPTEFIEEIQKGEKEFLALIEKMARTNSSEERNYVLEEVYQKKESLDKIKKQQNSNLIRYELSPSDIGRFALNFLRQELNRERTAKDGRLRNVYARLSDLVLAAYITSRIDGETFLAMLEMPELRENHKGFWEKAGEITWGVARMTLSIIPVTAPYIALAYVIKNSYDQRKELENEMAEETHLIR